MKRRAVEIERKIGRLADLISETTAPAALLRQIEVLESERDELLARIDGLESERTMARTLRDISAADVRRMLRGLADDMNAADPESLQDTLRQTAVKTQIRSSPCHPVQTPARQRPGARPPPPWPGYR